MDMKQTLSTSYQQGLELSARKLKIVTCLGLTPGLVTVSAIATAGWLQIFGIVFLGCSLPVYLL